MKIALRVPGYSDVVFDSYEDLNIIWEFLDHYPDYDTELIIIKDNDEKKIEEKVENVDEVVKSATLTYTVPKSVTFTQRFQERVQKEINDILNSVYPDSFSIVSITYGDIEDDLENMTMNIEIEAINDKGMENLKYLDKNVEYIMKDLIDYYL